MKKLILFGIILLSGSHLFAQQSSTSNKPKTKGKIKIVKNENGKTSVIEKDFDGQDSSALLDSLSKELKFDMTMEDNDKKGHKMIIKTIKDGDGSINVDSILKSLDIDIQMDLDDEKTADKKIVVKRSGKQDQKVKVLDGGDDIETIIIKKKNGKTETINLKDNHQTIVINGKDSKPHVIVNDQNAKTNGELQVNKLEIYPNPAKDAVTLSFGLAEKGATKVKVSDANGKVVYSEEIIDFSGSYQKEIPLNSESKGVYIITIEQNGKELSKKIIKQ